VPGATAAESEVKNSIFGAFGFRLTFALVSCVEAAAFCEVGAGQTAPSATGRQSASSAQATVCGCRRHVMSRRARRRVGRGRRRGRRAVGMICTAVAPHAEISSIKMESNATSDCRLCGSNAKPARVNRIKERLLPLHHANAGSGSQSEAVSGCREYRAHNAPPSHAPRRTAPAPTYRGHWRTSGSTRAPASSRSSR